MLTTVGKLVETSLPRSQMGAVGIQIYKPGGMIWSKKMIILRNAPYTIANPRKGQVEARLNFATEAHKGIGQKGLDAKYGLPGAASFVKETAGKFKSPSRLTRPYPSEIRRTFRTEEELKALLETL